MDENELKPCPFCGGEAAYVDEDGMVSHEKTPDVACLDTGCMPPSAYVPEKTWQSRPLEDALTAEVTALRARVAELEAEARWVSVDERLPEVEEHVLTIYWTFGGGSAATIRALLDTGMWFDCGSGYLCPPNNVTHWRPLPAPPEADNE